MLLVKFLRIIKTKMLKSIVLQDNYLLKKKQINVICQPQVGKCWFAQIWGFS